MEKRINYYVSRKNAFTWLSALSIIVSIIIRIIYDWGTGQTRTETWGLIVLPIVASIIFVVEILTYGKEHFYRTAVPVGMICLYYAIKVALSGRSVMMTFLYIILCIFVAYIYGSTVSGKEKNWLIACIFIAFLAVHIYTVKDHFFAGEGIHALRYMPDVLMVLSGVFIVFAMQIHLDDAYHPYWGDRTDGRRLRSLDPISIVANYIMPNRQGASNHIQDKLDVSNIDNYIAMKRKEGYKGFGFQHVLLAAYVRCVAKYPALNRFLSGQRVYTRGDDIQFCMVVKSSMTTDAQESIIKLHLKPSDTIFDIYSKLSEEIEKIKNVPVGGSDFDKTAKFVSLIPGLVIKFGIWFIKLLDYFGLIPQFLLEISPFHASVFFTSMGSLGIPPVVHHLYDFGNMPVFISFGAKYTVNELDAEGKVHAHKYVDYTFNTDERICDGFYYATVFKYLKKVLAHPEKLEIAPEEVIKDID